MVQPFLTEGDRIVFAAAGWRRRPLDRDVDGLAAWPAMLGEVDHGKTCGAAKLVGGFDLAIIP